MLKFSSLINISFLSFPRRRESRQATTGISVTLSHLQVIELCLDSRLRGNDGVLR